MPDGSADTEFNFPAAATSTAQAATDADAAVAGSAPETVNFDFGAAQVSYA